MHSKITEHSKSVKYHYDFSNKFKSLKDAYSNIVHVKDQPKIIMGKSIAKTVLVNFK